jgi:diketogulonate reductase-like aldo/keto reductase
MRDATDIDRMIKHASSHGIKLIDTAEMYRNKSIVIRSCQDHHLTVGTKVHGALMPGATLDLIYQTFIANGEIPLERVLMHHPLPIHMWRDMERVVRLGYTKTIGISNIDVRTLHCLLGCAEIMPSIVQSELHPFLTDLDQTLALISYCRDHNI